MNRPNPIPVTTLKNLHAALQYVSTSGKNNCIQRSAALALDLPGSEIMFATFRAASEDERLVEPNASPVPFVHAWVEWREWAYSPTTLERTNMMLVPWDCEAYRKINEARDVCRLPRSAFERIARHFRLAAAFKHGRDRAGQGDVADALLRSAGVRYTLSENRSVIPLG